MDDPRAVAERIGARVIEADRAWGNYTLDLALEAMLEFHRLVGAPAFRDHALGVVARRIWKPGAVIPYEAQPFCHLDYYALLATGDRRHADAFVTQTERYRREVTRSPEGAVAHRPAEPGRHILVDMLQDYAARMAHAGALTGDESYFAECAEQHRIYRAIVRDPHTGLWSQGRGWLEDPMALSPGAWSRGHGWILRGMVASLDALPRGSAQYDEVRDYLRELADALLPLQDNEGMWHTLLHLPHERSAPESSGTGLICHALGHAVCAGHLPGEPYGAAARRAWKGLATCVDADGIVHNACKGPGPLRGVDDYLDAPIAPGDSHGPFAVLFACASTVELGPD